MNLETKKQDLLDIENSLIRLDEVISRQLEIISQLEQNGQVELAKLAKSLLRQYEDSFKNLCVRRDWLRQLLGRDYRGGEEAQALPLRNTLRRQRCRSCSPQRPGSRDEPLGESCTTNGRDVLVDHGALGRHWLRAGEGEYTRLMSRA